MKERAMADDDPFERLEEQFVRYSSDRFLLTYMKSREGAAIWAAYLEWRRKGLAVPENILSKIDEYANAVLAARSATSAAAALELNRSGRSGTFRERVEDAARSIDAMGFLADMDQLSVTERTKRAVKDFGFSMQTVRDLLKDAGVTAARRGRPKKSKK
ncbi:hypothetical protein WL28_28235 [Burkholderia ubonensis]|nr:hypothetical protein WL28_28235 [Burkholderia ubonensis]